MTFAFVQDAPATEEIYARIREELGAEAPEGLIVHLAATRDGGTRFIDVWESEEAWRAFAESRLEPAVDKVLEAHGIPRPDAHPVPHELELIDIWLGTSVPA